MFSTLSKNCSSFEPKSNLRSLGAGCLELEKSLSLKFLGRVSFYSVIFLKKSPSFYMSSVCLLKTLWKKEKLLIMSTFYSFTKLSTILIKYEIVVCKLFQFGRVKNLLFGKKLTTTKFLPCPNLKLLQTTY